MSVREYIALINGNRNFRLLWFSAVTSYAGDWLNFIASADLVNELTDSGAALSYLLLARFLPSFFLSPFAGVLADKIDRRLIMIVTDVLRIFIVLAFVLIDRPDQVWILYLLTVLQFALSSAFIPAKSATIATVVAKEDLVTANALDSATWSMMFAVGSLIGGVVAGLFGGDTAFVLDAGTFALSGLIVSRLPKMVAVQDSAETTQGWRQFAGGITYLIGLPFILALTLAKAGGSLIWGATNVLEIQFANEVFTFREDGALTLGIIYFISGIGTGVGPIALQRLLGNTLQRLSWGILLAFVMIAVGILGLSVAPTFALFLLATFVRTVGSGTLWVFSSVLLQREVADNVLGRVFGLEFAALTLTQALSILWAGWGRDLLGLDVATVTQLTGYGGLVIASVWLLVLIVVFIRPKSPQPKPNH